MALVKNQIHFFTESAQMIKSFFSLATASAVGSNRSTEVFRALQAL